MGYYRRYSLIYYTIALLCGALWLWMALVGSDSNFFVGLLLFFLVICLTAFFCSLAATRRFQAATQRLMQTADIASFLQELNGCAKSSRRNTYNTILFWQVYALQLAGNLQRAADLLQHADPNYARSARGKKNDRCAYSVRCASLALQLGQLDLADTHIESLRQELRTLQSDRALYPHYTKCLTDLAEMSALLRGEGSGQSLYFSNLLKLSSSLVDRVQTSYYLGIALIREGKVDEAVKALRDSAQGAPKLLTSRRAAVLLEHPDALQSGQIDAFLFSEL